MEARESFQKSLAKYRSIVVTPHAVPPVTNLHEIDKGDFINKSIASVNNILLVAGAVGMPVGNIRSSHSLEGELKLCRCPTKYLQF